MPKRRIITLSRRRRIGERLALAVVALQTALLLMLAVTPADNRLPPRVALLELLWAAARQTQFIPLLGVLIGAPILTIASWRAAPGRHRVWLLIAWPAFIAIAAFFYHDRLTLMLRILWSQVGW